MRKKQRRIVVGAFAGLAGGLVGSFAMNEFQAVLSEFSEKQKQRKQASESQSSQGDSDDATMKTADGVARLVIRRPLSKDEKKKLGPVVHYAFGGAMGALYGALVAAWPEASAGFGTAFGTALFALADETAVPLFGLSKAPTKYPLSSHAKAMASHLVYATTTEAVRRIAA